VYASLLVYEETSRSREQEALILDHLGYVRQVFGKLAARLPPGTDIENLEAAGVLGLVEAARQYDPSHGTSFKTYAYLRIQGAMLDELRRNCPLPQAVLDKVARIRSAYERLSPPVTPEQLAAATELSVQEVLDCLEAVRLTQPEPWNDLHACVHQQWRPDPGDADAASELEEAKQVLADGIEQLPERERVILTMYYQDDLTLSEIGEVLQRSESHVSRVLKRAEFLLKEYVRAKGGV